MIQRYYPFIGQPIATNFYSNVVASNTTQTVTYTVTLFGKPGAVIVVRLTAFSHSFAGSTVKINGVLKSIGDDTTFTAGADGKVSFSELLDIGTTTPGNGMIATLTIESTSKGHIGSHNVLANNKTT